MPRFQEGFVFFPSKYRLPEEQQHSFDLNSQKSKTKSVLAFQSTKPKL